MFVVHPDVHPMWQLSRWSATPSSILFFYVLSSCFCVLCSIKKNSQTITNMLLNYSFSFDHRNYFSLQIVKSYKKLTSFQNIGLKLDIPSVNQTFPPSFCQISNLELPKRSELYCWRIFMIFFAITRWKVVWISNMINGEGYSLNTLFDRWWRG